MKKTAVEWLIQEMINNGLDYPISEMSKILEQAKEMEKEQIIEAFDEGQEYEYQYHINSTPKFDSLTYYNETFNQ